MPFDQDLIRRNFEKLERHLSKLSSSSAAESVHRFRTYSRRVEVFLDELNGKSSGNQKKLQKLLAKSRKKAGRVRDLDVQSALLRSLKTPQAPAQKSQLQHTLSDERVKREKKLARTFDKKTVAEMRKRLRRVEREIKIPQNLEPVVAARRLLNDVGHDHGPISEAVLHRYRIAGKRARYVVELAGGRPDAQSVGAQLKHMQDVIGDWHDWLQLTERAEKLFGGVQDSPLVAELRNVTRAKFREAVQALTETKEIFSSKPAAPANVAPKRSVRAQAASSAA
jgi:CHAD domain-containing protein